MKFGPFNWKGPEAWQTKWQREYDRVKTIMLLESANKQDSDAYREYQQVTEISEALAMKATELIAKIEAYAPRDLASGERVIQSGFNLRDPNHEIHTVMTVLDVRPEVVQKRLRIMLISFLHTTLMIFRPAKNLICRCHKQDVCGFD